jgi:type I restriction enzyme, S subunit
MNLPFLHRQIGDVVLDISTWNPVSDGHDQLIRYIDLSSVDQDTKVIHPNAPIVAREAPSRARQLVQTGDVLVSTVRPNLNGVAMVDASLDGATASTGFCVLRPNKKELDGAYLFHWVKTPEFVSDMVRKATGASYPAVSDRIVLESKIPLPSISEQKRIAAILDKAEKLRELRRKALAQLDAIAQSIFLEMFGNPTKAKNKFQTVQLGEVTHFIDYRGISPNKQPNGVRLVTARNIKRGWFEDDPQEFIPTAEYESWMRRGMPRTGDVLFTTEGHTLGSAAKLPSFEKVALAQRLIALQPKESVCSDYLLQMILSRAFQNEVLRRSTGSAARGISSKQLAEINLPLPPISLQQEFARRVETIEQLKTTHRESLTQLDALFASLQHRAFRGEL